MSIYNRLLPHFPIFHQIPNLLQGFTPIQTEISEVQHWCCLIRSGKPSSNRKETNKTAVALRVLMKTKRPKLEFLYFWTMYLSFLYHCWENLMKESPITTRTRRISLFYCCQFGVAGGTTQIYKLMFHLQTRLVLFIKLITTVWLYKQFLVWDDVLRASWVWRRAVGFCSIKQATGN